ncbi:hypothetical protein E2C01_045756 [Portunus trituberculatus]|uniref:Uncharacterized protein n=1 Tax=Portunus trituberculatus TaxID=210409 RepID=A0A5B7G2W0_PORTR|nr:hypothetical protein [Portunus trituberculatus]
MNACRASTNSSRPCRCTHETTVSNETALCSLAAMRSKDTRVRAVLGCWWSAGGVLEGAGGVPVGCCWSVKGRQSGHRLLHLFLVEIDMCIISLFSVRGLIRTSEASVAVRGEREV